MAHWEAQLLKWYGEGLPDNYLTFDCETTGFETDDDLPVAIGWSIITDRKSVNRGEKILDWTRLPDIMPKDRLMDDLERIDYGFKLKGAHWKYDYETLQRDGQDPVEVLEFIYKLFLNNRSAGARFAGHNAVAYDYEMLRNVFWEFLGLDWTFEPNEILDTGCMEKASRSCGIDDPDKHLTPEPHESMLDFFHRVRYANRPGIKWSIETCLERYNIAEKHNIQPHELHCAEMDSHVCYLLIEHQREAYQNLGHVQ